jgi:hypothetical protein
MYVLPLQTTTKLRKIRKNTTTTLQALWPNALEYIVANESHKAIGQ